MINPLIYGLITGLIKPLIGSGGDSACNVYLFSSANSDSLEIESFTGNLKVMIAAPSEAGINPAIIAGRQGDFVASADPVNEPTVIQYEIEASAITQIVSSTFNGIVYKYYKDNVKYDVSMGAPVPLSYLSATQLFLLDSLTAGPGNTKSVPYYIAKEAEAAGTLRDLWIRPLLGTIPDTNVGVSSSLGTASTTESYYSPSKRVINIDGTQPLDILSFVTNEFPWRTAKVYFEHKSTGGTFDITAPVTTTIDLTGVDGTFGYVEITNPSVSGLDPIRLSNFTTSMNVSGIRITTSDITENYLDIINFAFSGQKTAIYNECLNIADWYTELGITGACINTGTNDSAQGYLQATQDYRDLMDELVSAGVSGQDILIMRPNDNSKELGDMWEDIRGEYSTRFTSIVRIYGDLAEFQANNWMLPSDTTHPNETFNAIQATQEYALNLVDLHDQIDLGVQANWITEFNNLMWIQYDSTVTVSGDFSMQLRVRVDNRQFYLWDNEGDNRNSCRINTNGSIRLEIDNVITDSAVGGVSQNSWHTIDIERSGTTFTVNCDGVEVMNATVSTLDILFTRTGRSAAAYLLRGAIAWFTITGQHQWRFNQTFGESSISDDIGAIGATWNGLLSSDNNPLKLSVMPDGELLDYHYNVRTGVYWGDVIWPTGA